MADLDVATGVGTTVGMNEALRTRVRQALEAIVGEGFVDDVTGGVIGGGMAGLLPIDAIIPHWDELTNPRALTGPLPFRPWQCEALLAQASELLDRCVAERTRYDNLRERYAELWVDAIGALAHDAIVQKEHGSDQHERRVTQATKAKEAAAGHKKVAETEKELFNNILAQDSWNVDLNSKLIASLERLRCLDPYWKSHNDRNDNALLWTHVDKQTIAGIVNVQPIGNNAHPAFPNVIFDMVLDISQRELHRQRHPLDAQAHIADKRASVHGAEEAAAAAALEELQAAHQLTLDYAAARRSEIYLRVLALTEPGAPHNLVEQMRPLQLRFCRDLADAYARLLQAASGLQSVFGYPVALPDPRRRSEWSFLDLLINWSRQAAAFLVRFSQRDQVMIHTASVRAALGGDPAWERAVGNPEVVDGFARVRFEVILTASWRNKLFYPRLRGVAAHLVPKAGASPPRGVFAAEIRTPKVGETRYFDDNNLRLDLHALPAGPLSIPGNISAPWDRAADLRLKTGRAELDQGSAPSVRIGRVQPRNSVDGIELVGTTTLMNLSPFSPDNADQENQIWTVLVDAQSTQGEELEDLTHDIELELHIAYQAQLR